MGVRDLLEQVEDLLLPEDILLASVTMCFGVGLMILRTGWPPDPNLFSFTSNVEVLARFLFIFSLGVLLNIFFTCCLKGDSLVFFLELGVFFLRTLFGVFFLFITFG